MHTDRLPRHWLVWVFLALLAARILGLISVYFFEEDEVSLALGVAALVADTAGSLYRYTVQVGYYRLIELLDFLLGGRIDLIPWLMKGLSAVAGAVIPVAGFFAFRNDLSLLERRLVVLMLAINPIIWRSSQYGNTAMVATAMGTVGLVLLTNRPRPSTQAVSLALLGGAMLVRADTVLLVPVAFLLMVRARRSVASAAVWLLTFGALMGLIYAALFAVDSRMDNAIDAVSRHMATPEPSMFWEYLLWAMSPFPLILAIWGIRNLIEGRAALLGLLLAWCLPTLLFYFRATTTCRYFLNAVIPLSIAAAVGMQELAARPISRIRAPLRWAALTTFVTLHLFVALGRISPTHPMELFYGGTFQTHDGPMPTGALIVRTFLTSGSLLRGLPAPSFATQSSPFWEGVAFERAVHLLADPAAPQRTVVVLLSGGFAHAFHYHAHAAGARYVSRVPDPDLLWGGETWMRLGNSRVMTISAATASTPALTRYDVSPGDQFWVLGDKPFPDANAAAKLPAGLALTATQSFDPHFRTFQVVTAEAQLR